MHAFSLGTLILTDKTLGLSLYKQFHARLAQIGALPRLPRSRNNNNHEFNMRMKHLKIFFKPLRFYADCKRLLRYVLYRWDSFCSIPLERGVNCTLIDFYVSFSG